MGKGGSRTGSPLFFRHVRFFLLSSLIKSGTGSDRGGPGLSVIPSVARNLAVIVAARSHRASLQEVRAVH